MDNTAQKATAQEVITDSYEKIISKPLKSVQNHNNYTTALNVFNIFFVNNIESE